MISIQKLLSLESDILDNSSVKLVRHKDGREEYRDLLKNKETLLEYQKEQGKEVFKNVDYIVSFIGLESTKALLFGVFKVLGVEQKNEKYYYDLQEVPLITSLVDRVIIDWGKATTAWHQWYEQEKEVLEILPKGYIGDFPGLTNFVLEYEELKKLVNNKDSNRDWYSYLSSVNAIYMILDTNTGNQYIGSAYGKQGLWQRWVEYSKTKHGGNVGLKSLVENKGYERHFQFTVLQALPSNMTSKEVIKQENLYKTKFGSRAFGLNSN